MPSSDAEHQTRPVDRAGRVHVRALANSRRSRGPPPPGSTLPGLVDCSFAAGLLVGMWILRSARTPCPSNFVVVGLDPAKLHIQERWPLQVQVQVQGRCSPLEARRSRECIRSR